MTEFVPKVKFSWFVFYVNKKRHLKSFSHVLLVVKKSELVFVGDGDKQDQVEDIEDKEQQ